MEGWIKLHRKLAENPMWTSEPFTDGQAWVDLILLANHKEGQLKVRGIRIVINRGQVGWSEIKLAKRWKWSRGKIRRFLRFLENEKTIKIVQQKNKITTLITILKYETYQESSTTSGTTNGQQTDTNKNEKNDKEVINILKNNFIEELKEFKKDYSSETLNEFYEYWSEPNKSKTKLRYQLEKTWDLNLRLKRWQKNKNKFKPVQSKSSKAIKTKDINYDDEPKRNY